MTNTIQDFFKKNILTVHAIVIRVVEIFPLITHEFPNPKSQRSEHPSTFLLVFHYPVDAL